MSWMKSCYSRLLIDNHITDQRSEFMSRFEPEQYAEMVRLAGVESAMVYACDHNGNCYYLTRCGHIHANLNGRDIFGETVALLNRAGVAAVAYYTVIYHNHSAVSHPEWRMRSINGAESSGRYHFSCPNSGGYREFARRQLEEIAAYPVSGIFIDMTFWPLVCTCDSCRTAYRAAAGEEIPEIIDWRDPCWVRFQRWRERSMAEFGAMLTDHVKSIRPELTVAHQFSPVLHGWFLGQCSGTALASDYASGDFYGGKNQQRIGVKLFAAYSKEQPYEFMTSRCVDLHDHTSSKSADRLFLHAVTTLANGGAFLFIDAINPDGTLNRLFYERLHSVVKKLEPFRRLVQAHAPTLRGETGLYFSMNSCVNEALNGVPLREDSTHGMNMDERENAVVDEAVGTAALLSSLHVPYRIITDLNTDYAGFRTIVVNNAAYLSAEECGRLREFVRNGGTLIATGKTSLFSPEGETDGNFQLADVFGVSYTGKDTGTISYLEQEDGQIAAKGVCAPLAEIRGAELLGTVSLPWFPPGDPVHYASIHSDPPGLPTGCAGLTVHRFGRGTCVWLYSALLKHAHDSQQEFGRRLLCRFVPAFVERAENLPRSVELTLLKSTKGPEFLLGIVNAQEELPVIPVHDLRCSLRLPDGIVPEKIRDQNGDPVEFQYRDGVTSIFIRLLNEAAILEIIPVPPGSNPRSVK